MATRGTGTDRRGGLETGVGVCRPPPAKRARWRWQPALLALIEGADPAALSMAHLAVATPAGGADRLLVSGFTPLLDALAAGLDIRWNQPAQVIAVGPDHVTVTIPQETYQADRVLVTLPLGVLQAGTVAFSPPCRLPSKPLSPAWGWAPY